jgi:hypothetical protein
MADVETYATHLFSYRYKGRPYTVDIVAKDAAEAKERLKALAWAEYDGELVARLPASLGIPARIAVRLRNVINTMARRQA